MTTNVCGPTPPGCRQTTACELNIECPVITLHCTGGQIQPDIHSTICVDQPHPHLPSTPIPTLGEWSLIALTPMILLAAMVLTQRQREVASLISRGNNDKEISRELGIAYATVKCHVRDVLNGLGVRNRIMAAVTWDRMHRG